MLDYAVYLQQYAYSHRTLSMPLSMRNSAADTFDFQQVTGDVQGV